MATIWHNWDWHLGNALIAISGALARVVVFFPIVTLSDCASAQITPDGTLPNNSIVTLQGNTSIISEGTTVGDNLFHSFDVFSIRTGGEAYFNNAPDVQNIFSRVTGRSISHIDGLLRANHTANLFLLNPNGIVFGPQARLNIGGSFVGSTASSINFADGRFSATEPTTTPLLNVSVPLGLQYGANPGKIQVQGNGQGAGTTTELIDTTVGLRVQPNQTLALVGGDIALSGGTLTTAGRIELGSVAAGRVNLTPTDKGWAFGYEGVPIFGDIQLSGAATVGTSGAGSGDIQVWGGRLTLKDGSRLVAINLGLEAGGTIAVNAEESFEITGTGTFVQDTPLLGFGIFNSSNVRNGIFSLNFGSGAAGNVVINTPNFVARNGAFVATFGQDQGGGITLNAESVELSASALSTASVFGATGNLTINTGQLIVRDNGLVATRSLGQGQGGNLTVRASEFVELIGTDAFIFIQGGGLNTGLFTGSESIKGAGDLQVVTERLILRDGAAISASTGGNGQGGDVTVTASESVKLIGRSPNRLSTSIIAAGTGPASTGSGGKVAITTGNLTVQDGAEVTVISRGTGYAGELEVVADSIRLDNEGKLNAASSSEGGDIRLQAQNLQLRHNSQISTSAGIASGAGNGGNIVINAGILVAVENSDIIANAFFGQGGRVEIAAQGVFGTEARVQQNPQTSDITASSDQGPQFSGIVEINTPDVDPAQGLVELPEELADASNQIATGCSAGGENKFIITGRGGLPPNPRQVLRSNAVQVDWVELEAAENRARGVDRGAQRRGSSPTAVHNTVDVHHPPDEIVEAQGWIVDANSNVTLIATAPTAMPHSPWQTPDDCREVKRQ